MEEFKVVTKTLDQVVGEMLEGKHFYVKHHFPSCFPVTADNTVTMYERVKLSTSASTLWQLLQRGDLYEEVHWTEQLDGTYENGVWCKVGMKDKYSGISKVLDCEADYPKYKTLHGHYAAIAEPVSKELAELLEKEMK